MDSVAQQRSALLKAALEPTDEEKVVMRQCASDSFWYRALPLSVVLGAATRVLFARGVLKPSARFGIWPQYGGAVLLGYIIGKVSFIGEYKRRLEALPGASARIQWRQDAVRRILQSDTPAGSFDSSGIRSDFGSNIQPQTSVQGPNTNYSAPSQYEAPQAEGLDDYYRPSLDSPGADYRSSLETPAPAAQRSVSYKELREQNRANHGMAPRPGSDRFSNLGPPSPPSPSLAPSYQQPREPSQIGPSGDFDRTGTRKQTNKYGDVWEV